MYQKFSDGVSGWQMTSVTWGKLFRTRSEAGLKDIFASLVGWFHDKIHYWNDVEGVEEDETSESDGRAVKTRATTVRRSYFGLGLSGFHKISYQDWPDLRPSGEIEAQPTAPVICVHGLTRNSHDFDKMAARLCRERRVVCPDVVGRGQSDWLENAALYENLQYNADMNALIARLDVPEVDWVGTSMGGLIGMMLAASAKSPIRKMVINDVGPYISYSSLSKIGNYVGRFPEFSDLDEAEAYLREIHAPFAPMSNKDWRDMARFGVRELENGNLALNYDPKIGDPLRAGLTGFDVNLWPLWDMITCPVLVFRGENSELLTQETAERMATTGPLAEIIEIKDAGHAPTLNTARQIGMIRDWLDEA